MRAKLNLLVALGLFLAVIGALASVLLLRDSDQVETQAAPFSQPLADPVVATTLPQIAAPSPHETSPTSESNVDTASESTPNQEPTLSGGGWINPIIGENVGHPNAPSTNQLTEFTEAGASTGVNLDAAFLQQHSNAAWLKNENGRPIIDGLYAPNTCLNILTTLTLRNSYINCPVRKQADPGSWGYFGGTNDTSAVRVAADDVVIERNTITCSGFDGDICRRNINLAGRNAVVRYNDLSFARGAISIFHGAVVEYNYMHSFSYGFDPNRAGNRVSNGNPDEITHNNAVNNQGYTNATVKGNYIDARYGRVSNEPTRYLNPYSFRTYENRIVRLGDPINGFTFTNYLSEKRNGSGYRVVQNYVNHSGRPFRCNSSSKAAGADCLEDFSNNAFENDHFDQFGVSPLIEDKDRRGSLAGSCNYRIDDGSISYLPNDIFGNGFTHQTGNC